MNDERISDKAPKIFMKGTPEWKEYLDKHPDIKREEQMTQRKKHNLYWIHSNRSMNLKIKLEL